VIPYLSADAIDAMLPPEPRLPMSSSWLDPILPITTRQNGQHGGVSATVMTLDQLAANPVLTDVTGV
jgi:hypothetical protein